MKKFLFLLPIIIVFATPVVSMSAEVSCGDEGECLEGDCENGQGTYEFSDGSSYNGQWKNGSPEGNGILTFTDGTFYEGIWKFGIYTRQSD